MVDASGPSRSTYSAWTCSQRSTAGPRRLLALHLVAEDVQAGVPPGRVPGRLAQLVEGVDEREHGAGPVALSFQLEWAPGQSRARR